MTAAVPVVLALYAGFLALGWRASRRAGDRTPADLLLAGRTMPLWLAALTMTATWVDGGYLLGTAEGAFKASVQLGLQGGVFFGGSLILGGLFFAARMRRLGFTTLVDPFEARFGRRWAAVLALPALAGELFWSAELLVAIGAAFGALLGMPLATAIVLSALVTTAYTAIGGMWSVAYTDVAQLGLVVLGLAAAVPFALQAAGGLGQAWHHYAAIRPDGVALLPPVSSTGAAWPRAAVVGWWDTSAMLLFGGIPWNCYFQRVLSCRTPGAAAGQSVLAGVLTIALTVPPLLIGIAACGISWPTELALRLSLAPADTMPLVFAHVVPPAIGLLGLAAIIGAVTSSFSSSILSAGSMVSWNIASRLLLPSLSQVQLRRLIQGTILVLGTLAGVLALRVQSVQALWFFTSDLVFVLLFPQLVSALFDPRANRLGSIVAFVVSLAIRAGAGEPLLGIPAAIAYPEVVPVRVMAAVAGLVLLPLVSRLTAHLDTPRPLHNPAGHDVPDLARHAPGVAG